MTGSVEPGMVVRLDGDLAEIVAVVYDRAVIVRKVGAPACTCGAAEGEAMLVVGSMCYAERVKPVETIS